MSTTPSHRLALGALAILALCPAALAQVDPATPATRTYRDEETRQVRRHHLHESVLQRAVKDAVRDGWNRITGNR